VHAHWRVYHPDRGNPFDTLPVIQGQACRFLIEVHPEMGRWRASISNGSESIWNTLRNGEPLKLRKQSPLELESLRWEFTVVPNAELLFSLDAIRIQNRPVGPLEAKP
jgi:hypothetical protein